MTPFQLGLIQIALASFLWGAAYFFRKVVLGTVPPLLLSFSTLSIGSVFLFLFFRPKLSRLASIIRKRPFLLTSLAISGSVAQVAMFYALDQGNLSVVVLLERIQPIIGMIIAALFVNEKIPKGKTFFVISAVVGSALLSVESPSHLSLSGITSKGIIGVLIASTGWALCTVLGRAIMRSGSFLSSDVTIIRLGLAALAQFPFLAATQEWQLLTTLNLLQWSIIIGCGIGGTAGGYLLYMKGLSSVSSPVAGFLEFLTPLTAVLLGVLILNDSLTLSQWIASVVMIIGIMGVVRR